MGLAALRQRKHYSEEGVMTQQNDRRQHEGRGNEGETGSRAWEGPDEVIRFLFNGVIDLWSHAHVECMK